VCTVSAGCTLIHILVGNTGVGKVFRLLTAALLVCITVSPLASLVKGARLPAVSVETEEVSTLQDTALLQIKELTETRLLTEINEALASYELKAEKLEISMDISGEGNISITDVRLYIPAGNAVHRTWIAQIATRRLGMTVTVENEGI